MKEIKDLTVAIIGCGNIARLAWANNFQALDVGRLLCFDLDTAGAAAFAREFGGEAFGSLEALLAEQPHGVVIATPAPFHFEPAMAALLAGAHVMVEKPMTTDLAEAVRLVDTARELERRIHQPFHQLIMLEELLTEIRAGAIGDLEEVRYTWWRAEHAEGLLEDLGPHAIAMAGALLPLDAVTAVETDSVPGADVVTIHHRQAKVTIDIASGLPAMETLEEVNLEVRGKRGVVTANMRTTLTPSEEEYDYQPRLAVGGDEEEAVRRLRTVGSVQDARRKQAGLWVASLCVDAGLGLTLVDGQQGLEVQSVLDAAKASAAAGGARVVPVPVG